MLIILIFVFSALGIFGDDPNPECVDVVKRGYQVAAFFGGFPMKAEFKGVPIDLLTLYNQRVEANNGTFNNQSSRLLLGYSDEVIVLPYFVGEIVTVRDKFLFVPRENGLVQLSSWIQSDRDLDMSSEETSADFGELDPTTITLFQDTIFAGDKMYDIIKKDFVQARTHASNPGNHFDLTDETSIAGGNGSKTLVGVIDRKRIYRQKCKRKAITFNWNCSEGECKRATVNGDNYCFYVESCRVAFGPEQLFQDILMIPEAPIQKPVLRLVATKNPVVSSTKKSTAPPIFAAEVQEEENSHDYLPYYHHEFPYWKHPLFKGFATFILVQILIYGITRLYLSYLIIRRYKKKIKALQLSAIKDNEDYFAGEPEKAVKPETTRKKQSKKPREPQANPKDTKGGVEAPRV
ncbi:hypothetical protein L596_017471 [Steinernema carpocapsae]|uniref:Uncharacterized protein n=1 Tax=Steinernema carpocapsae TaxID=34508 RepID=A0A4U5N252_STECR|nr:hypothetical protein L596_017471 [Steinernema carpocapsae]